MTTTNVSFEAPVIVQPIELQPTTVYDYWINVITTDREIGSALAAALGGPGDAHTFDDENCMRLIKDGVPAWASAVPVREAAYLTACEFRDGGYPQSLGLPNAALDIARAKVTVQCGTREDLRNTLPAWVASLGYEVLP